MVVHIDNCSVHRSVTTESFMKTSDMILMPHPPCSPNRALSDFYFFLTVKEKLEHAGITAEDQLFEKIHTIMRSIPEEELKRAFEA
jgi:hypothetical protein